MFYAGENHTWIICAYGESEYLEECIHSLMTQSARSRILMATSTPGPFLDRIAAKYDIPLRINPGEGGIGGDWNFALKCASTAFATLAHQDDVYDSDYLEVFLKRMNRCRNPLLYFTGYDEIRNGKRVHSNRLLRIKRKMLLPIRLFPGAKWARRLSLSFGNPICCPAITYRTDLISQYPFQTHFKSNLDWELSEQLSRLQGDFVYEPRSLMCHRIHEESTTSKIIGDHQRTDEDLEMLRKFWPEKTARRIARIYAEGEGQNRL